MRWRDLLFGVPRAFSRVSGFPEALFFCLFVSIGLTTSTACRILLIVNREDKQKGLTEMKSYKEIAEEAGTTVDVVREVAKTIYRDVTGWHESGNADGDVYGTKAEAIEAVAKRKQAETATADTTTGTEADADGHVYQGCNPQITPGGEIAWPWILPATEENKNAILCEILERFGRAE